MQNFLKKFKDGYISLLLNVTRIIIGMHRVLRNNYI